MTGAEPEKVHVSQELKHKSPLIACRFDPKGRFVFASAEDDSVQRWDLATGKATAFAGHESWVFGLAVHPSGETLLTGGGDGQLIWWPATADGRPPSSGPGAPGVDPLGRRQPRRHDSSPLRGTIIASRSGRVPMARSSTTSPRTRSRSIVCCSTRTASTCFPLTCKACRAVGPPARQGGLPVRRREALLVQRGAGGRLRRRARPRLQCRREVPRLRRPD